MKKFIKEFSPIWFVSIMGTSALALGTNIYMGNLLIFKGFARFLLIISFLFFLYFLSILIVRLFKYPQKVFNEFNFALSANLYAAIPIASSLIVMMLITIGLPFLNKSFLIEVEYILWLFSLILAILFVVIVPINLKFKSKIDDVLGVWFLPPVGLFVLDSAGSLLATQIPSLMEIIAFINIILLGPAFVLYFLTLTLVYFRSKFTKMPPSQFAPTFFIVLAPVGVSIIAILSLNKIIQIDNIFNMANMFNIFSKLYASTMWGYGLWVILGLSLLTFRFIKAHKIHFSPTWWAFIFPLGAFTNSTFNITKVMPIKFVSITGYILYFSLLIFWSVVIYNQIKFLFRKK